MGPLTIHLARHADGRTSLRCVRADGTDTWQTHAGPTAAFFPAHDLTHYAVETVLDAREGFYGLVARGWHVTDFGKPWPRGPLPAEALAVERLVGMLDVERATGQRPPAAEYAAHAGLALDDARLARIRQARAELLARWGDVPTGGTLELRFPPA